MSDLTKIAHVNTDIGTIFLGQRESRDGQRWIYEITINGELLMSSVSPVSEMRLSSSALALHDGDAPLRVLVGGLGLGYTAQAALADKRVGLVRVVEAMQFIIDWMDGGLFPLSEEITVEERIEIVRGDVYSLLLGPASETYDLILVDVDHAPDDLLSCASTPFYTVQGQQNVARHLAPGGIMGVWSAFDNDDFADVLEAVYAQSSREIVSWPDDESPGYTYDNVLFFGHVAS